MDSLYFFEIDRINRIIKIFAFPFSGLSAFFVEERKQEYPDHPLDPVR